MNLNSNNILKCFKCLDFLLDINVGSNETVHSIGDISFDPSSQLSNCTPNEQFFCSLMNCQSFMPNLTVFDVLLKLIWPKDKGKIPTTCLTFDSVFIYICL